MLNALNSEKIAGPQEVSEVLKTLPLSAMNGPELFLAVALAYVGGCVGAPLYIRDVQQNWPAHLFNSGYSPAFYPAAKLRKWVLSKNGKEIIVTEKGARRIAELRTPDPKVIKGLSIFDKKTPHTFDKTLRTIIGGAKELLIADTYVDDEIFDRILDAVPIDAEIRLLWGGISPASHQPQFSTRVSRFSVQYPNFKHKQYSEFHDRFFIVDGEGYMLGPSIKDAAAKKPATLIGLDTSDSEKLKKHFEELWNDAI